MNYYRAWAAATCLLIALARAVLNKESGAAENWLLLTVYILGTTP